MCTKVKHLTDTSAELHADSLERDFGIRPKVFYCTDCGAWHVGYTKAKRSNMSKKQRRKYKSKVNHDRAKGKLR